MVKQNNQLVVTVVVSLVVAVIASLVTVTITGNMTGKASYDKDIVLLGGDGADCIDLCDICGGGDECMIECTNCIDSGGSFSAKYCECSIGLPVLEDGVFNDLKANFLDMHESGQQAVIDFLDVRTRITANAIDVYRGAAGDASSGVSIFLDEEGIALFNPVAGSSGYTDYTRLYPGGIKLRDGDISSSTLDCKPEASTGYLKCQ